MPNPMADRATSDLLIGPDWAMNLDICDILNHDPGQARDFVKGLRKRIRSKNPKVQLLALTLLETVVKNCGDMVHMHIADKDIPHEMVKIVKKKPDCHVKEKILMLIDTWQEAFGGLREKYPQFFIAHQDLLHAGIIFPKQVQMPITIFPPTESRPPSSYPHPTRKYDKKTGKIGPIGSEILVLSLADIQKARGIMDVLVKMLNSLETENKKGVKQETIVELVEQCRLYRQRVVHLVNSTSEEELLCQGLALNDDLQNVLSKYDSLSGISNKKLKQQKSLQALVDFDNLNDKNEDDNSELVRRSGATDSMDNQPPLQQLLLPAPPGTSCVSVVSPRSGTHIDLLSGDEFGTVSVDNSLVVPASETNASLENAQNILVISGVYSSRNSDSNNCSDNKTSPELAYTTSQLQQQQRIPTSTGFSLNHDATVYQQAPLVHGSQSNHAYPSWNNQFSDSLNTRQQAQNGALDQGGALPPPPWETELAESSQILALHQHFPQSDQAGEAIASSPRTYGIQHVGMSCTHDQAYDHNAFSQITPSAQAASFNYGQQPDSQFYSHNTAFAYSNPNDVSQRLYGLSMHGNAHQTPPPSQLLMKQSKPEDNLFGDLVSMAKSNKPAK